MTFTKGFKAFASVSCDRSKSAAAAAAAAAVTILAAFSKVVQLPCMQLCMQCINKMTVQSHDKPSMLHTWRRGVTEKHTQAVLLASM